MQNLHISKATSATSLHRKDQLSNTHKHQQYSNHLVIGPSQRPCCVCAVTLCSSSGGVRRHKTKMDLECLYFLVHNMHTESLLIAIPTGEWTEMRANAILCSSRHPRPVSCEYLSVAAKQPGLVRVPSAFPGNPPNTHFMGSRSRPRFHEDAVIEAVSSGDNPKEALE
jgi:hypothetical protein